MSMMERRNKRWRETQGFHWVALGRLSAVKDYPTMLRAFATIVGNAVSTHGKSPTLTIAGEGPEEDALRRLAQELQIAEHVHFVGFQHDVQRLLGAADAFVLSSLWEGLPLGVLEAQAAGLPVVATDGPGTRHALIDGITGLLVPVGDVSLLTKAMRKVMAMPCCEQSQMGTRGHDFVDENFSIETVIDRWDLLYGELLAEQPRASRLGH
jgi:glycosyltransferase involved in cell wall biosynthesis